MSKKHRQEEQLREQLLRDGVDAADIDALLEATVGEESSFSEDSPQTQTYIINTNMSCQNVEAILYQYLEDNELPVEVTSVVSNDFGVVNIRLNGPGIILTEHAKPFQEYVQWNEECKQDPVDRVSTCKVDIPQSTLERIQDQMVVFTENLSQEFGVRVTTLQEKGKWCLQAQSHSHELLDIFLTQSASLLAPDNIDNLEKYFPNTVSGVNISSVSDLLLSDKKRVLNFLAREYSVTTRTYQNKKNKVILEATNSNNQDAVILFIAQINNIVRNPQAFQRELVDREEKQIIHLFVDISNIEIGCKNLYGRDSRIDVEKMTEIVVNLRGCGKKLGVGSFAQNAAAAVEHRWKKWGYEVHVMQRLSTGEEQGVDETIHAAIQQDILKKFSTRRTLVVLTGDGNNNSNRTNFPEIVEQALLSGWKIEIWSWKDAVSTIYKRFQDNYSSQFSLKYLDTHKDSIVFQHDSNQQNKSNKQR